MTVAVVNGLNSPTSYRVTCARANGGWMEPTRTQLFLKNWVWSPVETITTALAHTGGSHSTAVTFSSPPNFRGPSCEVWWRWWCCWVAKWSVPPEFISVCFSTPLQYETEWGEVREVRPDWTDWYLHKWLWARLGVSIGSRNKQFGDIRVGRTALLTQNCSLECPKRIGENQKFFPQWLIFWQVLPSLTVRRVRRV